MVNPNKLMRRGYRMTNETTGKTTKGAMTGKEGMTLEKRIKNLQVSISIARAEIKDILQSMPILKGEEKQRKVTRLAVLEKIIDTKTKELEPLKAQRERNPRSRSKTQVSQDEINAVLKKHNIVL